VFGLVCDGDSVWAVVSAMSNTQGNVHKRNRLKAFVIILPLTFVNGRGIPRLGIPQISIRI
jgi:hypothetical protein